jgi:hypothetical protein
MLRYIKIPRTEEYCVMKSSVFQSSFLAEQDNDYFMFHEMWTLFTSILVECVFFPVDVIVNDSSFVLCVFQCVSNFLK